MLDGAKGLVAHQLLRPSKKGDPYFTFSTWKDQEAWKIWMDTEGTKYHENSRFRTFNQMIAETPFTGFYEPIVTIHG